MLLVTGGAGFIGSNIVAALNDAGRSDVAVCDVLGHDGKWRNLAKRQLADFVPPAELLRLAARAASSTPSSISARSRRRRRPTAIS